MHRQSTNNSSNRRKWIVALAICMTVLAVALPTMNGGARPAAQIPTGSIPTVTGTPVGAMVLVLENEQGFVNVRAGPSTVAYEILGVLVPGQTAPALARTSGGDWIQVVFPSAPDGVGWVWSDLVDVRGNLPMIEAPPTRTPLVTSTIDPTLAAQFLVTVPPTRLPTFTAPPSFIQPTMPSDAPVATTGRLPIGMIIIGMLAIGLAGMLISFLGGR